MTTSVPASRAYATIAQPRNGVGIAALCCGIAGILTGIVPFMFLTSAALAGCALVFGAVGIQRVGRHEATNRGVAIAGLITGAIAAILAAWGIAIVFGGLNSLGNDLNRVQHDTGARAARLATDQHLVAYQEHRLIREGEFIGNLSATPPTAPTPVTERSRVLSGRRAEQAPSPAPRQATASRARTPGAHETIGALPQPDR